MYYAHSKGEQKKDWQPLEAHLRNTAKIAAKTAASTNLKPFAELAGLLHDCGKYSPEFQARLEGKSGLVDHSTAGAQLVNRLAGDNRGQRFIAHLLAFCIAGHHAGLPDYGSAADDPSAGTLLARLKRPVKNVGGFFDAFPENQLNLPQSLPLRPLRKKGQFSVSFLVRMIYSMLVDADFLETEHFMNGPQPRGGHASISSLESQLLAFLKKYDHPTSPINIKRTELLHACLAQASRDPGIFSLTIPTGGGKTYTSLAFALSHARHHGLKRVIYCIPFTSIIEQNARVFRDALGQNDILEHHSNFDWKTARESLSENQADDQTNAALEKLKLAAENWDIPIVVTTNVQFFESLFANRSSRCRKLHALINSVIIFDEAQMIPSGYLEPCMLAVAELVKNYGSTAILCTATQPPLSKFLPEDLKPVELITEPVVLYRFFKRVTVQNLGHQTDEAMTNKLMDQKQALCIVNTRRHAAGLYQMMANGTSEENIYHLSTLMCPAHRKAVIKTIRERLAQKQPCRVVSTQLIEAGVDLDFPVGFRALAGLDSIVQAAGRVNREGRKEEGVLYIFRPDTELIKRVPAFIAQAASVAQIILKQHEDPISIEALSAYYRLLYDAKGDQAFDKKAIMTHFEKDILEEPNFDFKTAAEKFKLIENHTLPVIIPWDDAAEKLINQLIYTDFPYSLQRRLQPYTVNIYPREFAALEQADRLDIFHERFAVLKTLEEGYCQKTGLTIPEGAAGDAIFY